MFDLLSALTPAAWVAGAIGLGFSWALYIVIHRLYLSPLAHIPGPKLAALTLWYEFFYDVVLNGMYTFKIAKLHERYGPIIRINPFEVHINDPDFYEELYTGSSSPRDKWLWSSRMFGNGSAHFATVQHDMHRLRRQPLNQFFSRRSVFALEHVIKAKVDQLIVRLKEYRGTGEPVLMRHAFSAFVMDVVTEYCFGTSYKCLEDPKFAPSWVQAIDGVVAQGHTNAHFPWLFPIMQQTPHWMIKLINADMMLLINFRLDIEKHVANLMNQFQREKSDEQSDVSIFRGLLAPDALPDSERTLPHLVDEGQAIVAAGQVTTANFFNATIFHVLANPEICTSLKQELQKAMPDGNLLPLTQLEQLPYLSAVIKEGYRLSLGTSHRSQRISPSATLHYKGFEIPAGTPVSMTNMLILMNPDIFPSPRDFRPERWLDETTRRQSEKYLIHFGRGTRSCLGMNLANAEIYMGFAALFRTLNMEIFETTRANDIDVVRDFFTPQIGDGSLGLRVLIH